MLQLHRTNLNLRPQTIVSKKKQEKTLAVWLCANERKYEKVYWRNKARFENTCFSMEDPRYIVVIASQLLVFIGPTVEKRSCRSHCLIVGHCKDRGDNDANNDNDTVLNRTRFHLYDIAQRLQPAAAIETISKLYWHRLPCLSVLPVFLGRRKPCLLPLHNFLSILLPHRPEPNSFTYAWRYESNEVLFYVKKKHGNILTQALQIWSITQGGYSICDSSPAKLSAVLHRFSIASNSGQSLFSSTATR